MKRSALLNLLIALLTLAIRAIQVHLSAVDEGVANPQAVLPLQQAKRFAKTPV